jgi:prolyl oligopeptidase
MKFFLYLCLVTCSLFALDYPNRRNDAQVDFYHGVEVRDPYRYLEDPNSEDTQLWIREQNDLTQDFLEQLPEREAFRKRLTELWNFERYECMFNRANRYFFKKNDGLQNQSVLYTIERIGDIPEILLDPNLLSEDGTASLNFGNVSSDGKKLAYGISQAGSDWVEIKVRDVATKQDLSDHLKWVKFSQAAWLPDGTGFYYSRYAEPTDGIATTYNQKLYLHKLGTDQADDLLVYERPDHNNWIFIPSITEDGQYLVLNVWTSSFSSTFLYKELASDGSFLEPFPDLAFNYMYVGNEGTKFWFITNDGAPCTRVISLDLRTPARSAWQEVIPERKDPLEQAYLFGNHLVAYYLQDVQSVIELYNLDGSFEKTIPLPPMGTVGSIQGNPSSEELFFTFQSFIHPPTLYCCDMTSGESSAIFQSSTSFASDEYETKQVFYPSKDGTIVPMFISHKKGLQYDGNNPTCLYAYGSYGYSTTPWFTPPILAWLERGGVYAVANIRGGGEYGVAWHLAGNKKNDQNRFNDFIAAAEWLVDQQVTAPSKLAISGASSGGMLIGACLNQRPDLFGAATPHVGTMDLLRFHKFTIGHHWTKEYGSPDDPDQFDHLYKASPLHNIRSGSAYPPTLIFCAECDDRVVPAHSYKFAATLQEAQASSAPILIRIESKSGHGLGKPTYKLIDEAANKWAFLFHFLSK